MISVRLLEERLEDCKKPLRYAVIAAKYRGRWVLCQHKQRSTWEVPGGHIEQGETPEQAARRELFEESGAEQYRLYPIGVYGVSKDGEEDFGALFFADIASFSTLPEQFEMKRVEYFDQLPEELTYPQIQPFLVKMVEKAGF